MYRNRGVLRVKNPFSSSSCYHANKTPPQGCFTMLNQKKKRRRELLQRRGTKRTIPLTREERIRDKEIEIIRRKVILSMVRKKRKKKPFLPPQSPENKGKKVLVLDLDETLIHSSFEKVDNYDFTINLRFDQKFRPVYIRKRPHVDVFLQAIRGHFEIVVFTASMKGYANAVLNQLDPEGTIFHHRLYRRNCTLVGRTFQKDLSRLGRDLSQTLIIDNSPVCYEMQPENGIHILSWFENPNDTELLKMIPIIRRIQNDGDVYDILTEIRVFEAQRVKRSHEMEKVKKTEYSFFKMIDEKHIEDEDQEPYEVEEKPVAKIVESITPKKRNIVNFFDLFFKKKNKEEQLIKKKYLVKQLKKTIITRDSFTDDLLYNRYNNVPLSTQERLLQQMNRQVTMRSYFKHFGYKHAKHTKDIFFQDIRKLKKLEKRKSV